MRKAVDASVLTIRKNNKTVFAGTVEKQAAFNSGQIISLTNPQTTNTTESGLLQYILGAVDTTVAEFNSYIGNNILSIPTCSLPQAFTINHISDNGAVYYYSWTPSANATSYTFGALNADGTAEQTSANTVTFTISSTSLENLQFQIVALNDCGSNAQVNSQGSPPCFLAGALITYADGSVKPIEDVKVGDMLLGAFGEINTVLALHRPLLGDSLVYKLNGEHDTSDHHPHISVDKKFYANNLDTLNNKTYGTYQSVILADGSTESWHLQGLKKDRTQEMVLGILLQTTYGGRKLDTLESYSLPPDTQMYNLAMSGSHTYFVNGYAVTGWPREDDFDYDTWTPK